MTSGLPDTITHSDAAASSPAPDVPGGRVLLVKAKGGLGNRMLSAVTGCVYAQLHVRQPCIDWGDGVYVPQGENLYPLLFEAQHSGDPAAYDGGSDAAPPVWSGRLHCQPVDIIRAQFPRSHRSPFVYRKLCVDLSGPDPASPVAVFWSYLPKMRRLAGALSRDERFAGRCEDDIVKEMLRRYFTPVVQVREAVDAALAHIEQPLIGIHLRFTDRKVPLPKVMDQIDQMREAQPCSLQPIASKHRMLCWRAMTTSTHSQRRWRRTARRCILVRTSSLILCARLMRHWPIWLRYLGVTGSFTASIRPFL